MFLLNWLLIERNDFGKWVGERILSEYSRKRLLTTQRIGVDQIRRIVELTEKGTFFVYDDCTIDHHFITGNYD